MDPLPFELASELHAVELAGHLVVVDLRSFDVHHLNPAAAALFHEAVPGRVAALSHVTVPADDEPSSGRIRKVGRALRQDAVTIRAREAMRAAGVDPILLKGRSIADWLYGPFERFSSDVDLLVAPAQYDIAEEALRSLGFEPYSVALGEQTKRAHAAAWRHASTYVDVDLHERIVGATVPPHRQWEVLDRHRAPLTLAGRTVDALDVPGRFVHLCLHLAQDVNRRPRKLEDLGRAIAAVTAEDWSEAVGLAEELGAAGALGVGLRSHPEGRRLADEAELPGPDHLELVLRSSGAPPGSTTVAGLLEAETLGQRLRYGWRVLFPPRGYMARWVPLGRREPLPSDTTWQLTKAYAYRVATFVRRSKRVIPAVVRARRRLRR